MLLAVLARVHTALSDLVPSDVLIGPGQDFAAKAIPHQETPLPEASGSDMGVAVSRRELMSVSQDAPEPHGKLPLGTPSLREDKPKKRKGKATIKDEKQKIKKKKKKAGDELSSLFGSLT